MRMIALPSRGRRIGADEIGHGRGIGHHGQARDPGDIIAPRFQVAAPPDQALSVRV